MVDEVGLPRARVAAEDEYLIGKVQKPLLDEGGRLLLVLGEVNGLQRLHAFIIAHCTQKYKRMFYVFESFYERGANSANRSLPKMGTSKKMRPFS